MVLVAETVVVLQVAEAVTVEVVGKGEAWLFRDGQVFKGQWEKSSPAARTVFNRADGTPLPIARGSTWIEVVPKEKKGKIFISN